MQLEVFVVENKEEKRQEFLDLMAESYRIYGQFMGPFLEEVMVFIDSGYLRKCSQEQFGRSNIDMTKFTAKLTGNRRLKRTYYYTARIESPPSPYWQRQQSEQRRFLKSLSNKPFIEPRFGRLKYFNDGGAEQKGVDVLLALDMLRFAIKGNYNTAILVSGDGDFADIVQMVKDEGPKVEIATFPYTLASQLLAACDRNIEITAEFLQDCWEKGSEGEETLE